MKSTIFFACLALIGYPYQTINAQIISAQKSPKQEKFNLLILLADDAGLGDYSCEGNKMVKTPRIDALSKESIQFDRFYVCPVSAPTRAEFLTGRYAYRGGVIGVTEGRERLDPNIPTIADYLKEAGYETGIFGKWHNGGQYPYHPNARGFDEFYGYCSGHWGNYWAPLLEHNGTLVHGDGYLSDDLASHAINFIKKNKEKNWLCYVPFNIPHSPMMVTDSWWNSWANREITQHATDSTKENALHNRAALALMENLDWNIGRLLDCLDSLGLSNNTLVVYFSDNGPNGHRFCQGIKGIKANVDEGGVRSPLFIRGANNKNRGAHINQLAGCIDLLPTLLDISGANSQIKKSPKYPLDGINLAKQLKDTNYTVSRSLLTSWESDAAIRKDSLLLTNDGHLFNLIKDPKQKHPLERQDEQLQNQLVHYIDTLETLKKTLSYPFFTVGDPREKRVKLPARDGKVHGGARRSNKFPNCSYFTNWRDATKDAFTWQINVLQNTTYDIVLHYRCEKRLLGSSITLTTTPGDENNALNQYSPHRILTTWKVDKAFYKPMLGADLDRVPRQESYFPSFTTVNLGSINLQKGKQTLMLKANTIKETEVMDIYMIELQRR